MFYLQRLRSRLSTTAGTPSRRRRGGHPSFTFFFPPPPSSQSLFEFYYVTAVCCSLDRRPVCGCALFVNWFVLGLERHVGVLRRRILSPAPSNRPLTLFFSMGLFELCVSCFPCVRFLLCFSSTTRSPARLWTAMSISSPRYCTHVDKLFSAYRAVYARLFFSVAKGRAL